MSTYQAARRAIVQLAPNEEFGLWKKDLLELKDCDARGPGREESERSESCFVQSWIWGTAPQSSTSLDDLNLCAALRVEWCKSQERAKRWEEEVELVVEEMRRTLATFEWNAQKWETLVTSPPPDYSTLDADTVAGITAYAHKQAATQREMIRSFFNHWYQVLKDRSLGSSWLSDYPCPPESQRHRLPSNVQLYHPGARTSTDVLDVLNTSPDDLDNGFHNLLSNCAEGILED